MSDKNFVPMLRFAVMSDLHVKTEDCIEEERLDSAIKYAYSIARNSESYKKLDAIVVVGDFANHGEEIEMQKVKKIFDANTDYGETNLIMSFASHETDRTGYEATSQRVKDILNQDADQHKVINGFHFVSFSPVRKCQYDENKIQWMAKELETAAQDGREKPIFVFQHPHNTNTVYGSILWGEDDLITTYMNYPQIVHFSGHSHAPINDPRSIHQKHFTSLGTGTLSYFELDEFDKLGGTKPADCEQAAQMLIVEVDAENRVRVYPFDVITGNFFPYTWKIDEPSNPDSFLYTSERYRTNVFPHFKKDAKITVSGITDSGFKVEFEQAEIDEDYVNCYNLVLKDGNGHIVRHSSIWSSYYLYDMPQKITAEFSGLDSNSEYSLTVRAEGFWNNISKDSLCTKIKTL